MNRSDVEEVVAVGSTNQARILVVEDDEGARRTLTLILERKNFEVVTAGTAQEALEKAERNGFDIGLLDIRLPDGKGVELVKPLRERHPEMELIMVTGYASTATAIQALNDGATAYITKPLNIDEVLAEVRQILEKQRLVAEKRRAEEQVEHVNAVLRAIRNINQLIVREKDPDRLIQGACVSLVDTRGYLSAAIALQDGRGRIGSTGSAGGRHTKALERLLEQGEWPLCGRRALDQLEVVGNHAAPDSCGDCPLRETDSSHGTLAAPLQHRGEVYGVLIVMTEAGFVSEDEISLFEEVSDDLALGLHGIRLKEERQRTMRELQVITDTVVTGSRTDDVDAMCDLIAKAVHGTNEEAYVSVSLFDRELDAIRIRSLRGFDDQEEQVFDMLGGDPRAQSVRPEQVARYRDRAFFASGSVQRTRDGLYDALVGQVPRETCQEVEALLGIEAVYGVGFALGDEPRGSITILMPHGHELRQRSAIETLASHFSVLMQRRQAEQTLRDREEKYRNLFQYSNDGILVHDLDGNVIDANQRVLDQTGYSRSELLSLQVRDIHPQEALEASSTAFNTLLRDGLVNFEIDFQRRDGQTFPAEVSSSLFDLRGRPVVQGIIRDITERKRTQEALAQHSEELSRLNAQLESQATQLTWLASMQSVLSQATREEEILSAAAMAVDLDQMPSKISLHYLETDESGQPSALRPVAIWQDGMVVRDHRDLKQPEDVEDVPMMELCFDSPDVPIFLPDVQADPRTSEAIRASAEERGFQAAILMPLYAAGRWHGVVLFAWSDVHVISNEERFYMQRLLEPLAAVVASRRAYLAQRASEARYRALFNNVNDAIFIHDLEGRLLEVNERACERLDCSRDALLEMTIQDIDAPEHSPDVAERIEDLQRRGHLVFETSHVRKDGSKIPAEVSSRLIDYGGGQAVLSAARDISDRLEMERQLQRQERLAAVGQLAGGIAHDFRNFLTTIILYAGIPMRNPDVPPDVKEALQVVNDEARQASNLVQQILDFSGRSAMVKRPVDLVTFIREAGDILRRTIPESIRVKLAIEPTTCVVKADATRIQQILMNLALNARDAMTTDQQPGGAEGGELGIALAMMEVSSDDDPPVPGMSPGGWVRLTVSDTGTGMSDEVKKRIFEPFFTTKERGKGTGLGLAQVYGIVQQHQGHIDVETELGEGTTFHVYLRAYRAEAGEEENEGVEALPEGEEEMVLLVEDQEKLREAGKDMLTSLGYRVLTAGNGGEALGILEGLAVDLVVTDIVMPEMGGKSLMRELGQAWPDLPVVAVTGYTMKEEVTELREAGFSQVLQKPFDAPSLARAVRRALDTERR